MVDQVGKNRSEIEQRLLRKKFGKWYDWKKPTITETVGPYSPDAFDYFANHLESLFRKAQAKLKSLSEIELSQIDEEDEPATALATKWATYLQKESNHLARHCPSWFAGGFGDSRYAADFKYWARMEELTLYEALLVSVGVEPNHISKPALENMKKEMGKIKIYPALEFLVKRQTLFQRKFSFGFQDYIPMSSRLLKNWFEQIDLEIHPEFKRELAIRFPEEPTSDNRDNEGKLNSPERKSLLKLVAGMACEQYAFDPKKQRSGAISSIRDDLEAAGVDMDSKTIRKWLLEAVKQVPEEYWKK